MARMAICGGRWRFVAIGFAMMLVLGCLDSWSIFVLPMEQEFGWRRDQTTLAYSLAMISFSIGILLGGPLVDRQGPRLTATVAGGLLGLGFFAVALTGRLWQLYLAYGFLCGLAIGLLYNCIIATVVRWFPEKRGLVTGLLMVGTGVGSMALGVLVAPLFQKIGWRVVFQLLGASALVLLVGAGQLLRSPGPLPVARDDAGLTAVQKRNYVWREVVRMPAFWGLWIWHLFIIAGGQSALGHIVPFGVEQGVPAPAAALAMGGLAISNACGRVAFGYLADQAGRRFAMMLAGVVMTIAMLSLALSVPRFGFAGLLVSAVLIGIGYGGTIPQVSAVVGDFFGPRHFGVNFGLASTGIAVAAIIGPYLSGWIKTAAGAYEQGFYLLGGLALVSSIIPLYIRAPQGSFKAAAAGKPTLRERAALQRAGGKDE